MCSERSQMPYRGTIVVDSCSLYALNSPIQGSDQNGKTHTYLEILPFLAQQGYKITIPDVVAYEAGSIVDRTSLMTIFNTSSPQPMYKGHDRSGLERFLMDAVEQKYPNISVERTADLPVADRHDIKSVVDYLNEGAKVLRAGITHYPHSTTDLCQLRFKLMDWQKTKKEIRYDFFDRAVAEHLASVQPPEKAILLSDDKRCFGIAMERGFNKANGLNASGLIHALLESGLSRHLPFVIGSGSAEQIDHHRRMSAKGHQGMDRPIDRPLGDDILFDLGAMCSDYERGPAFGAFSDLARSLSLNPPQSSHAARIAQETGPAGSAAVRL